MSPALVSNASAKGFKKESGVARLLGSGEI